MTNRNFICYLRYLMIILLIVYGSNIYANSFVNNFIYQFEENVEKVAFTGQIDDWTIDFPNVQISLGPGELSLFDFSTRRYVAMVYKGSGRFKYTPPDNAEAYQLKKLTKRDSLDSEFENIVFFFTKEFDNFPDTTTFIRQSIKGEIVDRLYRAYEDVFEYTPIYITPYLLNDIMANRPGDFFLADFEIEKVGHLAFMRNSLFDDKYQIYKLFRKPGHKTYDVIAGYSDDNSLVSQRGVLALDVTKYALKSVISGSGKMTVDCRINFNPLRGGENHIYLRCYRDEEIESVVDSRGDTLYWYRQNDDSGFGVVLNQPLQAGVPEYLDIHYDCNALDVIWGIYYVKESAWWHPYYYNDDRAMFELEFTCPKEYDVISCGKRVENDVVDGKKYSKWILDYPCEFVSFNVGYFDSKEVAVENLPIVTTYMSKNIDHKKLALWLAAAGVLSSGDMLGNVTADIMNSINFFTNKFGPIPFDDIRVTEIPYSHGQGTPGLLLLSLGTFQTEDISGSDVMFRAHEASHLWWGNVVETEGYRNYWLIEAMAKYCGFWFLQMSEQDKDKCDQVLKDWRLNIKSGKGSESKGTKAGPPVMGWRLNSADSHDYYPIVYEKGGYIIHMIRYMLKDFKTGSDDLFIAFLKDIIDEHKNKPLTTISFKQTLEKYTGEDMTWFFDQWVYGVEIPKYRTDYTTEKTPDGKYKIKYAVIQEKVSENFKMLIPITVLLDGDRYIHLKIWVEGPETVVDLPLLPLEPKDIVFNTYDAVLCR